MADLGERQKKAFDLFAEMTKQVISLAVAAIGFVLTVSKLNGATGSAPAVRLELPLALLVVSTVFGILALGRLIGSLEEGAERPSEPIVRGLAIVQHLAFLAGVIAAAAALR